MCGYASNFLFVQPTCQPNMSSEAAAAPRIFQATYSGVPVYEMLCKSVAVMRRQSDSYLNATQILKVAGFDKPQRTRILEREVQIGQHEKVQGGYGKYQGNHGKNTFITCPNNSKCIRHLGTTGTRPDTRQIIQRRRCIGTHSSIC
jgi:hypothetical protein